MSRFDEQAAQVLVAMAADAATPAGRSAIIESRIEPDIFHECFGLGEALDISNESPECKSHHFTNAAQAHQG